MPVKSQWTASRRLCRQLGLLPSYVLQINRFVRGGIRKQMNFESLHWTGAIRPGQQTPSETAAFELILARDNQIPIEHEMLMDDVGHLQKLLRQIQCALLAVSLAARLIMQLC